MRNNCNNIRVGIQILGDSNWPAGVNYVESLVQAVNTLPTRERPQLFLVAFERTLHAIHLHQDILPLLNGIIFAGKDVDRARLTIRRQFQHLRTLEELFSVIDFFYPVNSDVLPDMCSASWIPDFQHIHLPDFFSPAERQSRDTRYQKIARLAKLVVFSSEDARKDFQRLFPDSQAHARVLSFHAQFPDEWYATNPTEIQNKYRLPNEFLLCSNQFWIHKNHPRLFEALALLHRKGKNIHLVCTGPAAEHRAPNFFLQLQQMISKSGIGDLVHVLGVIPRNEQIQLMRRAMAVVQPSLFEGWSTVVEDARALGKTIILSDLTVHYEQKPQFGVYFERLNSRSIADTIEKTLPILSPGPDTARESEAKQNQQVMTTQFARTFCDIVAEGVSLFKKPETIKERESLSEPVEVSIIVATKDRAQLLDEMLTSLEKAAEGINCEVIVIEGNSKDNTVEILGKHDITQIYNEKEHLGEGRHSWPELYNFGFSKARGKWAMFASDDITFLDGCFSSAVSLLNSQEENVAGGIFFYKNVVTDVTGKSDWRDFGIDYTYGQRLLLNYGLVRLDAFREVNGLDEQYHFYCADGDLCLKLYEQGKDFIPLPGCFVIHNNVADSQKQKNMQVARRDIDRYGARWKHFVSTALPNPRRLMWKDWELRSGQTEGKHLQPKKDPGGSRTESVLDEIRKSGRWSEGQPLRLHLGCGEQCLDGYINIDYPASEHNVMKVKADIHADITKLDFPAKSVDEVRLHHVFEHFNRVTALAQLIKWHRWLKTGGTLWIETPDLIGSAKTLLSDMPWRVKTAVVRHLTGDQASAWAYHIDQWFPERFSHTLGKLGFDPVETKSVTWQREPYLSNVHAIAKKSREHTAEELLRAAEEILWESTVADTEKPTYEVWKKQLNAMVLHGEVHPHKSRESLPTDMMLEACDVPNSDASGLPLHEIHNFNQLTRDRWVQKKAKTITPGSRVLDIGAGTCPYRRLFSHCEYKTHDFKKYTGEKLGGTTQYGTIDYESDITAIPVPDGSFDVILCTEVLEHVPEPLEAIGEMVRVLKPGGRLLLTAPLGAGLHQMPYHYYGGFTPEWYNMAAEKFNLRITDISPNGGFFKLLAQECARVAWIFDKHRHLHGAHADKILQLFNEMLPRYLFNLDKKCFIDQFTVGYEVEMVKQPADKDVSEESRLLERLLRDFRDVPTLIRLAEIELERPNRKKAKNYVIAAMALEPENDTVKALSKKVQG